jgi:hypothetical protein
MLVYIRFSNKIRQYLGSLLLQCELINPNGPAIKGVCDALRR